MQDLMEMAENDHKTSSTIPCCDKCDGAHETETCPFFPQPPENHPDATMNKGENLIEEPNETLPNTALVIPQQGDGSCVFHAMAYVINQHKEKNVQSTQLRAEAADFIQKNKQWEFQGKTVQTWIDEMEGHTYDGANYEQELRNGMYGGILEIQIVAHLHEIQFKVFVSRQTHYSCVFQTAPGCGRAGFLWLHGEKMSAHYDVLENEGFEDANRVHTEMKAGPLHDNQTVTEMSTESEMQTDEEGPKTASKHSCARKRPNIRCKLSLKRTTTQYHQVCGICQVPHTRRRTSILCPCGLYVHLQCLGPKTFKKNAIK